MRLASGFQIAFLLLSFEFFVMLAANALAVRIGWPKDNLELLGQAISVFSAATLLVAVPALRRFCADQLRRPIPRGAFSEVVLVSVAKIALPFAVLGGVVLVAFGGGSADQLSERIRLADPVAAWAWALSSWGLARQVLACVFGPVIEELAFRGFLYRAFEQRWGWVRAMVLTSICFGLIHPAHMLSTGLGSVVLICLLRRTGSLRACIVVHALFNMLVSWPILGQFLFTAPGGDFARLSTWSFPVACLVFTAVALPAYVWMSRVERRSPAAF